MSITSHIKPSHNYVPEYQQSGIPWVLTKTLPAATIADNKVTNLSEYKFTFEFVTRWLMIHNHDHQDVEHLRVYFSEASAESAYDGNSQKYFLIDGGLETNRIELKSKYIYIMPDDPTVSIQVSVLAGLTNISKNDFPEQTVANGFVGV